MHFRTILPVTKPKVPLQKSDSVRLLGSCFSDEMLPFFDKYGFDVKSNPLGISYNPVSIHRVFDLLYGKLALEDSKFLQRDDLIFHYDLHSKIFGHNKAELLETINNRAEAILPKHIFLTYGTSWVYCIDGDVVNNCHKQKNSFFTKRLLTIEEMLTSAQSIFELKIPTTLTVSPVRHLKDGFTENQRSKARLIEFVHASVEKYAHVDYFPSYEIMMDDLRDYRFYKDDLLHPSLFAVQYIWNHFETRYFSEDQISIFRQIDKISQRLSHIPFVSTEKDIDDRILLSQELQKLKAL